MPLHNNQQTAVNQPMAGALPPQQPPRSNRNFSSPSQTIDPAYMAKAGEVISKVSRVFSSKVVGQDYLLMSLMVSLLTNGHILLESVPGLAKTTGAKALADAVSASFSRIQCTPDILPSDILGTQIYNYSESSFQTQLGPVHANFVLLDEINRSSSKTQSAMLEAMQERQTTIGGKVYPLPNPFLVLATQNPIEQEGTYELPEAQMDRFLLKEVLSYPTPPEEMEILNRIETGVIDRKVEKSQTVSLEDVLMLQDLAKHVYIDNSVKQYIVSIIDGLRYPDKVINSQLAHYVQTGPSPRGSIALMQVSRALALINGRDYVTPDDVKMLRYSALRHRLILNFEAVADSIHPEAIIDAVFTAVLAP